MEISIIIINILLHDYIIIEYCRKQYLKEFHVLQWTLILCVYTDARDWIKYDALISIAN